MVKIPKLKEKRRYGAGSLGMGGELSSAQGVGLQHVGKILGDVTSKLASAYFAHKQTETNTFTKQASTLYQAKVETLKTQIQNDPDNKNKDHYKIFQEQIVPLREAFREELKKEADNGSISFDSEEYMASNKMLLDTIDKASSIPLIKTAISKLTRGDITKKATNAKTNLSNLINNTDFTASKKNALNFEQINDTVEAAAYEMSKTLKGAELGLTPDGMDAHIEDSNKEPGGFQRLHDQIMGPDYSYKEYRQELKEHAKAKIKKRIRAQIEKTYRNSTSEMLQSYAKGTSAPPWFKKIRENKEYQAIFKDYGISKEDWDNILTEEAGSALKTKNALFNLEEEENERKHMETFNTIEEKLDLINQNEKSGIFDNRKSISDEEKEDLSDLGIAVKFNSIMTPAQMKDALQKRASKLSVDTGGRLKINIDHTDNARIQNSALALIDIEQNIIGSLTGGTASIAFRNQEQAKFSKREGKYADLTPRDRKRAAKYFKLINNQSVERSKKELMPRLFRLVSTIRKMRVNVRKSKTILPRLREMSGYSEKTLNYFDRNWNNHNVSATDMAKVLKSTEYKFLMHSKDDLLEAIRSPENVDHLPPPPEEEKDSSLFSWVNRNLPKILRNQERDIAELKENTGLRAWATDQVSKGFGTDIGIENRRKQLEKDVKRRQVTIDTMKTYKETYQSYGHYAPKKNKIEEDHSDIADAEMGKNPVIENTEAYDPKGQLALEL